MCARTDIDALAECQDRRRLEQLARVRRQEDPPPDSLATITVYQRRVYQTFCSKMTTLRTLPAVKVLLETTQPAHVLMVTAVLVMSSSLLQLTAARPVSHLTHLVYLAGFSAHIGNQFWMTFVSGLALYFNLPRHDFGAVQKVLFPKYFSINSFLSLVTLITFTKLHHLTSMRNAEIIQVTALSACFMLELTLRLYVVPSVIHLITVKTELELAAGVGREVGHFSPGPLLECPYYKRLHLQFRRHHLVVAVGNIAAMACSSLHLYYLALHYASICSAISPCP